MECIKLTSEELEEFREVQIRPRADWPATFSSNDLEAVWPFISYGHTYEVQRRYLQGKIPLLDKIVKIVLQERPEGGRFFIDNEGVSIDPEGLGGYRIAKFLVS